MKFTFEWKIARTRLHLHANGLYTGISIHKADAKNQPELLAAMNLPPIPAEI